MSNNLSRTEVSASQNQKEVTINDSDGILDAAITANLSVPISDTNTATLTATQWTQNAIFVLADSSPAPNGAITINVPATTRGLFSIVNTTSFDATIQISGQSETAPIVSAGTSKNLTCDGSNVRAPTAGASTLSDLTDVDISSPAAVSGDYLQYDGTNWVPVSLPYDIPLSFSGTPTIAGQLIGKLMIPRALTFPPNFVGSYGHVSANPSIQYDIDVQDDGASIGTISISTGGAFTFSTVGGVSKTVAAGSRLEFYAPDGSPTDWTISDIAATLLGSI